MMYLGIDPGASGGLAVISKDGALVDASKMLATERDLIDYFDAIGEARAVLEKVWAGPRMGSSAAFKFGLNYGMIRTALTAARIPFDEVTPQKWQLVMGCRANGKGFGERDDTAAKNRTKQRAQQLFPSQTVTHAIADAMLLAEFCRRISLPAGSLLLSSEAGTNGKAKDTDPQGHTEGRRKGERKGTRVRRFAVGKNGEEYTLGIDQGGACAQAGTAQPGAPRHGRRT